MKVALAGWLLLALLPALLMLPAHADTPLPPPPLRLNSGVGAPYFQPDKKGFLELLVPEIFRRIGVAAEAVHYAASERAMINANNGIDAGVAMRIAGLEQTYPNLLRVSEKVIDNEFVGYATRVQVATTSFASLKDYQVGYISGWKVFESAFPSDASVTRAKDAEQLFSLLVNERADIILFERWQGNHILRERGIRAHMLRPPLVSTAMYMYLHKQHAHLLEPAARALRAMKVDGSYQRIAAESLPDYSGK